MNTIATAVLLRTAIRMNRFRNANDDNPTSPDGAELLAHKDCSAEKGSSPWHSPPPQFHAVDFGCEYLCQYSIDLCWMVGLRLPRQDYNVRVWCLAENDTCSPLHPLPPPPYRESNRKAWSLSVLVYLPSLLEQNCHQQS